MAKVSIYGEEASSLLAKQKFFVEVRPGWGGAWIPVPYIEPLAATEAASPGENIATFLYRFGDIKREDDSSFKIYPPKDLVSHFVRVVDASGIVYWSGILTDESFSFHGTAGAPQGDQTMTARGLDHVLDRISIEGGYTDKGMIDWCPPFNDTEGYGTKTVGNRSSDKVTAAGRASYLFSKDGKKWSNYDIIEYLLATYTEFPFAFVGQIEILHHLSGVYYFEGLTLKQALDKLIDRRRGIGWSIRPEKDVLFISVFSVFSSAVSAGDIIFPANTNATEIHLDDNILIGDNFTRISHTSLYDRIVIQGQRVKSCFSVSIESGTLVKGWPSTLENEYNNLGKDKAGKPLSKEEQDKRRSSPVYNPVFQRFIIPEGWEWTTEKGGNAVPLSGTDVTPWDAPRPLLRWLPILKEGTDGTEYEEPMAFIQHDGEWFSIDRLASANKPGAHLSMLDTQKGMQLNAKAPHVFGTGHFTGSKDDTNTPAVYDYETLLATIAVDTDTRLKMVLTGHAPGAVPRTLVLDVYDAERWILCKGTVVGVEDGKLLRAPEDIFIRDDAQKIKNIAALARAWYDRYRAAVRLTIREIGFFAPVGAIVEQIKSGMMREPVNTVLTSRKWDFQKGETAIETGYADVDVRLMLDIPGMSDFRAVGRAFNRQQAEIQDLKKRVSSMPVRLSKGDGAESKASSKPVDFFVDNFDRADADTPGGHWEGRAFELREGRIISAIGSVEEISLSTGISVEGGAFVNSGNSTGWTKTEERILSASYAALKYYNSTWMTSFINQKIKYEKGLSGDDIFIKIKIKSKNEVKQEETSKEDLANTEDPPWIVSGDHAYRKRESVMKGSLSPNRFSLGLRSQEREGFFSELNLALDSYAVPQIKRSMSSGSISAHGSAVHMGSVSATLGYPAVSINIQGHDFFYTNLSIRKTGDATVLSQWHLTEWKTVSSGIDPDHKEVKNYLPGDDYIHAKAAWTASKTYRVPTVLKKYLKPSRTGDTVNTFLIKLSGTSLKIFVNGVFLREETQDIIRTGSGISLYAVGDLLTADISEGREPPGISQIKAWTAGTPEPPDNESGHGEYDPEKGFVYTDKYHQRNKDGTATYNPNA